MIKMTISLLQTVTPPIVADMNQLLHQLSPEVAKLTQSALEQMVAQHEMYVFIAVDEDRHVKGTVTLVAYTLLSGKKAWIEDVVVDASMRGQGFGKKLVAFVLDFARQNGLPKVDLTSRPERIAANKLYQHLGFRKRDTNVYRLEIDC